MYLRLPSFLNTVIPNRGNQDARLSAKGCSLPHLASTGPPACRGATPSLGVRLTHWNRGEGSLDSTQKALPSMPIHSRTVMANL